MTEDVQQGQVDHRCTNFTGISFSIFAQNNKHGAYRGRADRCGTLRTEGVQNGWAGKGELNHRNAESKTKIEKGSEVAERGYSGHGGRGAEGRQEKVGWRDE